MFKLLLLVALGFTQAQQIPKEYNPDKKCRILSLSGGGSKGAYEVGVIKTVVDTLSAPDNHYDVVSGVSVGGINTAALSLFGEGEDDEMVQFLMDLWGNLTNRDVWQYWDVLNPAFPIYGEAGYLDDSPLYHYLLNIFKTHDNKTKRRTFVSAVDAESGSYVPFSLYDEPGTNNTSAEFKVSAVVGSASMPFIFPPMNMSQFGYDMQLIDGGSTWNNNFVTAIDQCMKIEGITEEHQIEVDVIVLSPSTKLGPFVGATKQNKTRVDMMPETLKFYFRNKEIKDFYQDVSDILEQMKTNPRINYRYYFSPTKQLLPEYDILEFGYDWTHPMLVQGI